MTAFRDFRTITGRKIRVRANYSKRHFTIKTESNTFRTYKMNQEEFESSEYRTGNDWQQFLNVARYFRVK